MQRTETAEYTYRWHGMVSVYEDVIARYELVTVRYALTLPEQETAA